MCILEQKKGGQQDCGEESTQSESTHLRAPSCSLVVVLVAM